MGIDVMHACLIPAYSRGLQNRTLLAFSFDVLGGRQRGDFKGAHGGAIMRLTVLRIANHAIRQNQHPAGPARSTVNGSWFFNKLKGQPEEPDLKEL